MYSLRLALSILCVYSTVNTSYAGGDRTGKMEDKNRICKFFPVTADAKITKSGEIKVPVANINFQDAEKFYAVEHLWFKTITDEPAWLEFPFTASPSSTDYSSVRFNCTLTTTEVEDPYHWEFTFKLFKGFLVDSQNTKIEYEIFATDTLSETVTIFGIEKLVLQLGTLWHLTDQDKKAMGNVTIARTSLRYLGPDDPAETSFTFIDLTRE